ncbi:hypothetical protein NSTCB13_05637 [Nostoc sp. DSM 114160]|jgi:hypothetical protein
MIDYLHFFCNLNFSSKLSSINFDLSQPLCYPYNLGAQRDGKAGEVEDLSKDSK